MKVAINITTKDWNRIIAALVKDGWKVKSKYEGFDAGIDFDFVILEKDLLEILFGWDNWLEGEIKCSDELFAELSIRFGINFNYGKPNSLKPGVITLSRGKNFFHGLGNLLVGKKK